MAELSRSTLPNLEVAEGEEEEEEAAAVGVMVTEEIGEEEIAMAEVEEGEDEEVLQDRVSASNK